MSWRVVFECVCVQKMPRCPAGYEYGWGGGERRSRGSLCQGNEARLSRTEEISFLARSYVTLRYLLLTTSSSIPQQLHSYAEKLFCLNLPPQLKNKTNTDIYIPFTANLMQTPFPRFQYLYLFRKILMFCFKGLFRPSPPKKLMNKSH